MGSVLVATSTGVALVAVGVLPFLNPVWVGFEQARTHADAFTGFPIDEVHRVTNAVLGELILGPATFLQQVAGAPVFGPRERQHLADVRAVLLAFGAVVAAAIALLAVTGLKAADRTWFWRSMAAGGVVLAGSVVVLGAVFALFFDVAFEVFHRLLFAGGSYAFDPLNERLVQLFPEEFWSETSIALAVVLLVLAIVVARAAVRRAGANRAPFGLSSQAGAARAGEAA